MVICALFAGYGYEPWHLRYIDDAEKAKEITSKGLTLEEYLGNYKCPEVKIDLGTSELFTEEQLRAAAISIKCKFASFEGCELHSIKYAGDENNNENNLADFGAEGKYKKLAMFVSDFHTPDLSKTDIDTGFESDVEMKDYQWWLGLDDEGSWSIVTWGY